MPRLALVLLLLAWPAAAAQGGHGHGARGDAAADELRFLQHMIPHHAEAVESAERLLAVTERPELQALLLDVIATQAEEIERMRAWIADWYPSEPDEAPCAPMMRDLADAPVAEQERAWLEDMVMHHMMAVRDSRFLLAQGLAVHPQVAEFARDVVAGQSREIAIMRNWLASWFPGAGGDHGMSMGDGMGTIGSMPMGMAAMRGHGSGGMHMGGVGMAGMHGREAAGPFDAATVEALVRAFLAGTGGGEVVDLHGPSVTYHAVVLVDGTERALVVDAATGEVRWADER